MSKIKEIKEQRAELFKQIEELRKQTDNREMSQEEQSKWDKLNADYLKTDKRLSDEERFVEMEKRQAASVSSENPENNTITYDSAFRSFISKGDNISAETREVIEGEDGITGLSGQVLVPKTMANNIEVALKSYGGMFEAGSIMSTEKGGDLIIPTVNDTSSKAEIVAEYKKNKRGTKQFGSITIKSYTYRTPTIPISMELLQDSAYDVTGVIERLLSDSFGRGINEHLTTGDGVDKPEGIIKAAFPSAATPSAEAISLDDILDLMKGVDAAYSKNAKFMLNTNTLYALMKIKDGNNNYIWRDSVGSTNATLFGKSYIINEDMPDIGPGNASVIYGDLSKYVVRMVKGYSVVRLNELLAEYLSIGIFGFARYDGKLIDAGTNPVHKLIHAAS